MARLPFQPLGDAVEHGRARLVERLAGGGLLAEVQGIELPPLMRTLTQLEKQGYLLRTVSPYDKRIRLLTLTPEGKAVLNRLTQVIETLQTRVSQNIAPEHLDIFSATLNQIACNLRKIREEDNKTEK